LRPTIKIVMSATAGAAVLVAGGITLKSELSDGPDTVPSCSWPLAVSGKATPVQTGLVKCYLRALAERDEAGLSAVADQSVTDADLRLSADARSGTPRASFTPDPVTGASVTVRITFANGVTTNVDMVLANPASWHSWRLMIGSSASDHGPAPAARRDPSP